MRTLLALCLVLQTPAYSADEVKITASALPPGDSGFRCEFTTRDEPNAVMLYLDDANWLLNRRALMTVEGTRRALKPTGAKVREAAKESVSIGDSQELRFAGDGVRLLVSMTATSDCPAGVSCSSIEYEAQVEVRFETRSTLLPFVGQCIFGS